MDKNQNNFKFIYTNNIQTKESLESRGYPLFSFCEDKYWVFLNTLPFSLDFANEKDVVLTNNVCF